MEGLEEPRSSGNASKESPKHPMKDLSFPPVIVMCKLFDTIVLPVLCYDAEVWGMVKSEEIEKIQFQFCKFILQVPTRAPTAAVMAELRRFPVLLHTQLKATKYVFCPPSATKYSTLSSRSIHQSNQQYLAMYERSPLS